MQEKALDCVVYYIFENYAMFIYKNVKRNYCIFCNITFQIVCNCVYCILWRLLAPSIGYIKIVSNAETDFLKAKNTYIIS